MGLRADRDGQRQDDSAYWRRRFLILGGGLVVLALLAWRFGSAHPAAPEGLSAAQRSSVSASSSAAAQGPDGLPSAAYGSPWQPPAPTRSVRVPSPTAKSSATGTPKPTADSSPSGSPSPSARTSTSAGTKGGRCDPAHIVLSLFTNQPSYGPAARPQFEVYAVSTATASCQWAYGPGSVRVVVTRHGQVVWDSAACRPGPAPTVRFSLGVPQLLTISWNRAAKTPAGCAGTLPAGAAGTFEAVAMSAGRSSALRSFTLTR